MKVRRNFSILVPLGLCLFLLAGCELSPQQKADLGAVQSSGVTPAIYDKMLHEDPLSVSDIRTLCAARVNEGVIIRYVRDQDTVYFLTAYDIEQLQKAGASQSLIDYLLQTGRYYPYYYGPPVYLGFGYGPWGYGDYGYWHRPYWR